MAAVAWTIAGSDPSGGAGLQADLKTFHQHRVHGCAVPTLITVQSTRAIERVVVLDAALVAAQLDVLAGDLPPAAIKTGALGNAAVVEAVAECVAKLDVSLVVDPVAFATHGAELLDAGGRRALIERLLPLATLVTPNAAEASALSGIEVTGVASATRAAVSIAEQGARGVLVKGGHLAGEPTDVLVVAGETRVLAGRRVRGAPAHGLGCALSAAITARLARGEDLLGACQAAKAWLGRALARASEVGGGLAILAHDTPVDD